MDNRVNGYAPEQPAPDGVPYSPALERHVLGTLFKYPEYLPAVASSLAPDDFFRETHRLLYEFLLGLLRRDIPIDHTTVPYELIRSGLMARVGERDFFEIMEAASDEPIEHHARRVRQDADYRRLLELAEELNRDSRRRRLSPEGLRAHYLERLTQLAPRSPGTAARPAHIGDVRTRHTGDRWLWRPWLPAARVCGIASVEGCGKTRLALDLCRRIYFHLPWPDGQPMTLDPGRRTLWVCSDANQDDLVEAVAAFGLPDEAVCLSTVPEDPYGGTDLDDPETLARIGAFLAQVEPALVIVDTLTNATRRDLCRQGEVTSVTEPLKALAQQHQTTFLLQLHLSKEGEALGRRIRGVTRTLMHLDAPDPEQPDRRRFWVNKSIEVKPPALGVTMGAGGNEYDADPPRGPDGPPAHRGGRPSTERERARHFILDSLGQLNDRVAAELCTEWAATGGSEDTFWRARDELVTSGQVTCSTGRPKVLRLIELNADRAF